MLGTVLIVVFLLLGGCSGLRWSDRRRSDAGPIQICSGENIQLFWNFTLDKGERVKGMVWSCHPEGKKENVLATFVDDHFVPMPNFSGRLAHLQAGGIELSCATILESGNYSITVRTEDASDSLKVHHKTANVRVLDMPKTLTGEIQVTTKEEAVRDVTTGVWHVQLSCGNFSDRGNPAVDVIWTTPRGEQLDSTSYKDGFFRLLLPNPLTGGNYTCSSPSAQAAMKCLPQDSPLLDTASVEVEENAGRFALLEARQQEVLDKIAAERDSWMGYFEDVANRTAALEQKLGVVLHNSLLPVSFHARLTEEIQLYSGLILKLDKVISNQGDGYDPSTGYFTAPENGTYFFIATTGPCRSSRYANMVMMKKGSEVAWTAMVEKNSNTIMGSCHATLYLKAGEKVWLQSSASNSCFDDDVTTFSGFRI